jgi:hypothetical protein
MNFYSFLALFFVTNASASGYIVGRIDPVRNFQQLCSGCRLLRGAVITQEKETIRPVCISLCDAMPDSPPQNDAEYCIFHQCRSLLKKVRNDFDQPEDKSIQEKIDGVLQKIGE